MTSIVVSAAGREGLLQAFILRDGLPAPAGDLCSAELASRIDPIFGAGTACHVVTVGGVPVRVTSRDDPDVGATLIAVRLLQGGLLGSRVHTGPVDVRLELRTSARCRAQSGCGSVGGARTD